MGFAYVCSMSNFPYSHSVVFTFLVVIGLLVRPAIAEDECGPLLRGESELSGMSRDVDDASLVLRQFEFPDSANVAISNPELRRAVYEAFGGKDFYTGQPMSFEDMRIDHIAPSSKGGPDNIYNYVPTTARINSRKSATFDSTAAVPMLFLVRTTYAPKVVRLYEDALRKKETERIARQRAAERRRNARQSSTSRATTNGSTNKKIVGREVVFASDERGINSILVLQEFILDHPEIIDGNEVILTSRHLSEIESSYDNFSVESAFAYWIDYVNVFADGRRKTVGGARFFTSLHSSANYVGDLPEGTPEMNLTLDRNPFDETEFEKRVSEEGGHVLVINEGFRSFLLNTEPDEVRRVFGEGAVPRSYFVNPRSIQLEPLNKSGENILKLISKYAKEQAEGSHKYVVDIEKAIADGHGDMELDLDQIMGTHQFYGSIGRNHIWVLRNMSASRDVGQNSLLRYINKIEFSMDESVLSWLQVTSWEQLDVVFASRNLDLEIELPQQATPQLYLR